MKNVRLQTLLTISVLVTICLLPLPAFADSDSNDSLDTPEVLVSGTVSGRVESHYIGEYPNLTHVNDDDIYRVSIPPESECEFRLKMIGEDSEQVQGRGYDNEKSEVDYSFRLDVTVPGEVSIDSWINEGNVSTDFYVLISGEGNYTLTVMFSDLEVESEEDDDDDPFQYHQYYDRPQIVNDGVYIHELPVDSGYKDIDTWYYLVSVEEWHYLTIHFEKLSDEGGTLYLRSMDPDLESTTYETIDVVIDEFGDNKTDKWLNSKNWKDDILLKVQGRGQYKLIIDTEKSGSIMDSPVYLVLLGTMISAICILMVMILIPVIIIVIVLISSIRHGRKKKK
jgi:hypothetical protein